MSVFDDLQAKLKEAGSVEKADLERLKDKMPSDVFEKLEQKMDANGDGKLSADDIKSIDFHFGDAVNSAKDKLDNLFGKK